MNYQYRNGRIVSKEELWDLWRICNPDFNHSRVEFEMNLICDINNGTLKEIPDEIPTE
jgi:hypothetical protein